LADYYERDDCDGVFNGRPLPRLAGIVVRTGGTNDEDRFDSSDSDLRGLPLPLVFGGLILSLRSLDMLLTYDEMCPHM